ncbi:hypothetical protein EMMF5_003525 [Cystobasidiomycetes sp. EMM_F5]
MDSFRGDLSLGLNAPLALLLASIRHLIFGNCGFLSLSIHVPSVRSARKLLGGPSAFPSIDSDKRYTRGELAHIASQTQNGGLTSQLDAVGLWMLAASRRDGKVSGKDVRLFQNGEIMEHIERRRKDKGDILPFWRGGPIWVTGHSEAVKKLFNVEVYR